MEAVQALKIENLSIAFGGLRAVDDLSFHIESGEIYGLIGPNGAGKTTAFNCITQFYLPNNGKVLFKTSDDKIVDLVGKKTHEIIKLGLVRTFQNVELIGDLSLLDNLLVGSHIKFKTGIFAQALRLKKARIEEADIKQKAKEILNFLKIGDKKDELAGGQPYGVLKKIELGRTLMSNPKLIILDEPAAGLNDTETLELAKLIKSIRDEYKCTVLLVEHDMRLVMDICDRICAISFGKKLAEGTPIQIQANKDVQEAYLGREE
ncbi:ABC transporter ATP-binding protein [uncultured Clostridium sp.]|jgi:branched-chain amino acid transport system ATP-binding protein|uniref:ABC transporter ATP-binding protein n=1 Tax=uncultured Clostridium sp. TaxID=59620 RepID=UPI002622208B|nr:ABC transporter ATP-binding protein [uncultured Clostridium sp.]